MKPPGLAVAQENQIYYFPIFRHDRSPEAFKGIDGGTVECIAIDPNNSDIIYAGTWGNGIYKSKDAGLNWTKINLNIQSPYIYDIAVDPRNSQHILVSAYQHGVNQSFDGGNSWRPTAGIPTGSVVYAIDFNPQNSAIVYLGLREPTITNPDGTKEYPGGVYKSFDGGSTWARKSKGLPNDYVYDIAIDPNNSNILYTAMHVTGVYKSTNGGDTWYSINRALPKDDLDIRSVDIHPKNSSVYIGHWDGDGLSYSTDGGENWDRVASTDANGLFVYEVLVDKNHPSTVYLITASGIFSCENPSATSTCSLINYGGKFVFDLALDIKGPIDPLGLTRDMYTGLEHAGVFKSFDVGDSFEERNHGIQANIINSFFIDPANPSTHYASSLGRGLYKSEDEGLTWFPINTGLTDPFVNVIISNPENPSLLYAGTQNKGVFISNDGGLNWTQSNAGLTSSIFNESVSGDIGAVDNSPYDWMDPVDRESFEGLEADQNSIRSDPYLNITTFSFDPSSSNKMIAGTNGAGVKISNDGGSSWVNSNLISGKVFDSFTDPSVGEYFYYIGLADSSVKVSNSSRMDWTNKNSGFHSSADVFSLEKISNGVYLAGTESGIYKTSNAGGSWTRVGLSGIQVADILVDAIHNNIVWAATNNGLYRSTDSGSSWAYYPIYWLFNKNVMTLEQIPGKRTLYIGTNGGNFYYYSP